MEHDGVSSIYGGPSTNRVGTIAPVVVASIRSSTGPDSPSSAGRILCPVAGCPEASTSSGKQFRGFGGIKIHINAHCTGYLSGAVPAEFLKYHRYSQCPVCDKVIHLKYNGTCPKCRPTTRAKEQMNVLRGQAISQRNNSPSSSSQNYLEAESLPSLPSLSAVHDKFVPTIKNVPVKLRRLWSQCLARSLAQAVWSNNVASWIELQMLAKCTLCRPLRGGKSHSSQKLAWTRARLQRWLAGERAQLWLDIPHFKHPKPKNLTPSIVKKQQEDRCINLTSEGGYSNACKALVNPPPLGHTSEVRDQLEEKHPQATLPVDLSNFGNASNNLVPHADVDTTERCIRSFHRLSGGGPSGLRPIHIKNCLSTEYRDEVLERCTALINVMAKGDAPLIVAPFLAGATLTALPKKDNGIRPVAVGEVWRRLTAKFLCSAYKEQASSYFSLFKLVLHNQWAQK
ncbi:unnamed protein product [Meganyctiphanes norvegica]|uniref:Reverse transcriptase n=1 Tax=Meganyctiphanes norvegica TaxID=48144 RepID=A0AAV2QAU1_MEGNR